MSTHTMYVLAGVSVVGLAAFIGLSYKALHKEVNPTPFPKEVVIDFKDCKKRGYQIVETNPEKCKTPNGVMFMNLEEYLSMTDTSGGESVMNRRQYDRSVKGQATSTYRGVR